MSADTKHVYQVQYLKVEGPYWYLHVPEIRYSTQAEGWDEADAMARDLIAIMTEKDPDSFDLAFVPLPEDSEPPAAIGRPRPAARP